MHFPYRPIELRPVRNQPPTVHRSVTCDQRRPRQRPPSSRRTTRVTERRAPTTGDSSGGVPRRAGGVTDPPAHMGTMNVRPRAVTIVEIHRIVEPVPVPRTRQQGIHLGPTTQRRIVVTLPELHLTTTITSLTTREPPRRHRAPRVRELHTERTGHRLVALVALGRGTKVYRSAIANAIAAIIYIAPIKKLPRHRVNDFVCLIGSKPPIPKAV